MFSDSEMNDFRTIKELGPLANQVLKDPDRFLGAYKFPPGYMKGEHLTSEKLKKMA